MADTVRTLTALLTLLADNTSRAISPQDVRDTIYSFFQTMPVAEISVNTTLDQDDGFVSVTAGVGGVTVTLPAVAAVRVGQWYLIQNADGGAGLVTIDGDGSETINGVTTKTITLQYSAVLVVNTGTEWFGLTLVGA